MAEEIFKLGELFEQVQMQNVFSDGKTFVDCTPIIPLSSIRDNYEKQKNYPDFDLTFFVKEHFDLPKANSNAYVSKEGRTIIDHIEILWQELTRHPEKEDNSLLPLPKPYIVPGGRFREFFYWDSYFTMLGLQVSGKNDMIENMVKNFAYLIDTYGYIPNGNRSYFLGRSQPPFFSCMVRLLRETKKVIPIDSEEDVLTQYLPQLVKEYAFWMDGFQHLDSIQKNYKRVVVLGPYSFLNHYHDSSDTPRPESFREDVELALNVTDKKQLFQNIRAACESGWDFSSRWYKQKGDFSSIHTTEIIPVDLNCLLYDLELAISEAYELVNEKKLHQKYFSAALRRKENINTYCWNDDEGFYFDYDYKEQKQKNIWTLAGVFPLFFNIASPSQAAKSAENMEKHFLCAGGLQTTLVKTAQQWDAPNGWAPLQYIAVKGLMNYGFTGLANKIAQRWMAINKKVFKSTGKMLEKYNVVDIEVASGGGEYPTQDGFGWTNGVYLKLHQMLNSNIPH